MTNSLSMEIESLPTNTDSSLCNMTYHNVYSPKNNQIPVTFFQTIKKSQRSQLGQKKKNQIFETYNIIESPKNKIENPSITNQKTQKIKENYLDLLVSSFDNMIQNGEITLNYLNSPTLNFNFENNSENNFSKKCENKICAIVVYDQSQIYHTKFFANCSYKAQSIWLCEKCHNAYKLGNYCYYCNIIYRDFEFNTQYYDKKKWIQCDYCQRWQHIQCEEKKGEYSNVEELALNPNFKYMCPFCRKERNKCIRQHNKDEKNKNLLCKTKRCEDKKKSFEDFGFVKKKRKKIKKER